QFLSIVCDLERTNQLNLLPDKDLVDLCPPIEPYQVTKNRKCFCNYCYTNPCKSRFTDRNIKRYSQRFRIN
ncbi:MAG: hypothetical protein EWV60_15490, partial [Microcystis sp. Msp_OC_L_20101000_S702]